MGSFWKALDPSAAGRLRRRLLREAARIVSEESARAIESVPGELSREQGFLLCALACRAPGSADAVEIGSFLGRSTLWIAHGVRAAGRGRVWAIDPHDGHERPDAALPAGSDTAAAFSENVRRHGFDRLVVQVRRRSRDAAKEWSAPIRLLWVDGSHAYEDVRDDLALFSPRLVPGGFLAMHDTRGRRFPGVRRAMLEFFSNHPQFERAIELHNMVVARRVPA